MPTRLHGVTAKNTVLFSESYDILPGEDNVSRAMDPEVNPKVTEAIAEWQEVYNNEIVGIIRALVDHYAN